MFLISFVLRILCYYPGAVLPRKVGSLQRVSGHVHPNRVVAVVRPTSPEAEINMAF